jgi:hypothetical protein
MPSPALLGLTRNPNNPATARSVLLATAALLAGACQSRTGLSPTPNQPDTLTIRPAIESLKLGQEEALTAAVVSGSAAPRTVPASWSSDAPDVAAISEDGRLRGLHLGKATIRATFQTLSAVQPLRVVPDYGGTWEGRYRVPNCSRLSGAGSDYCRFMIGASFKVRAVLNQDHGRPSGLLEFYDNTGTVLGEAGSVDGSIDDSGALVLTGTVQSVMQEQPGETKVSEWRTTLAADGDRMVGRFARNPHFRNWFGWQESREDCEIVSVARTQR